MDEDDDTTGEIANLDEEFDSTEHDLLGAEHLLERLRDEVR